MTNEGPETKPSQAKKTANAALRNVANFIRELRVEISPDAPLQQVEILFHVTMRGGITMKELSELVEITQPSVSRNVAALSRFHRLDKPGADLLETIADPVEPRRKLVLLTERGRHVMTKAMRSLDPDFQLALRYLPEDALAEHAHKVAAESANRAPRGRISPLKKK